MPKNNNYLGVDIGASGLKIVEFANDGGRARLITYGYSDYDAESVKDVLDNPEEKGKELADLCAEAGVTTKRAITGLPMSSVFSTLFTVENLPPKELEMRIKNKLIKLSPIPEKDLVLDWKKVSESEDKKTIKVSVTAASQQMINKYVGLFKAAGFQLASLETEAFAMVRSLLGKDRALSVIVDIGSLKSNILVAKDSVPVIHRTVKTGGKNISQFLAQRIGVDIKKAEEIKKNMSLTKMDGVADILRQISEPIINEVKYCQNLYSQQYNTGGIEKMVLTGGTALILGISDVLEQATGLRVFVGDPWARVVYSDELRPTLDKVGPRFSVAIGLAMRDIM
ncbi:type IV pilus assembly protein PilM [Patescibacteria group bacterium]|nr:type IV pilus assembly protein PilM [Patescibacteria group bacterium]